VTATAALAAAPAAALAGPAAGAPATASPSLSLAVNASGSPAAAVVGSGRSLWYYTQVKGKWQATRLAGRDTAYSGPSVASGPGVSAAVAVEGKGHSLLLFVASGRKWVKQTVAGKNSAYSAPSVAVGPYGIGIAVDGPHNSLWYYARLKHGFRVKEIFGSGYVYSAPSLVIRNSDQAYPGDPAGEADIAVEASSHALYYVHSPLHGSDWQNAVVAGPGTTYAAPSLAVLSKTDRGFAYIAVQGPDNSLAVFQDARGWGILGSGKVLLSSGWVYSAPSLVANAGDSVRPIAIAYQGASNSLGVIFLNLGLATPGWQNDPLSGSVSNVDSAPALAAGPAGQLDLLVQGASNSLWFYAGPPPSTPIAPTFTSTRIGKPGTAYGG
jgi:hypothetical protein